MEEFDRYYEEILDEVSDDLTRYLSGRSFCLRTRICQEIAGASKHEVRETLYALTAVVCECGWAANSNK